MTPEKQKNYTSSIQSFICTVILCIYPSAHQGYFPSRKPCSAPLLKPNFIQYNYPKIYPSNKKTYMPSSDQLVKHSNHITSIPSYTPVWEFSTDLCIIRSIFPNQKYISISKLVQINVPSLIHNNILASNYQGCHIQFN